MVLHCMAVALEPGPLPCNLRSPQTGKGRTTEAIFSLSRPPLPHDVLCVSPYACFISPLSAFVLSFLPHSAQVLDLETCLG